MSRPAVMVSGENSPISMLKAGPQVRSRTVGIRGKNDDVTSRVTVRGQEQKEESIF